INYDKNHAFIKMDTRAGAARALSNIRTKMKKLTKKWLVTSKQGGTGGRPVVGGVVVEEPDIVVGEGLSCGSINKK
ncbi:12586_t:CDS:2, partial [Entrophospora sp. SA101]